MEPAGAVDVARARAVRTPKKKATKIAVGGDNNNADAKEKNNTNSVERVTHRGLTLVERWIDPDTVEYTVQRSKRDALLASAMVPAMLMLIAIVLVVVATAMASDDVSRRRKGTPTNTTTGAKRGSWASC